MPEGVQKVFEPNNDGPDDRIVVERVPEARHFYVYHDDGDGERVGRVEVTPAYQTTGGTFDSGEPLMAWMIGPHLTGYKYKKEFRVRAELLAEEVRIIREAKKEPKSRSNVEGHDWRETGRWEITHDGVNEVTPGANKR